MRLYPGHSAEQVRRSATALAGDLFIAHSTWRWMDLHRRTGHAPVFYYLYAHPRPARRQPSKGDTPDPGAVHSGEIEYALGNLDSNRVYAWTPADHQVSRTMQGYFVHFIQRGDPNSDGLPPWPAAGVDATTPARQTIDVHTRSEPDRQGERQQFLQHYLRDHANPLGD